MCRTLFWTLLSLGLLMSTTAAEADSPASAKSAYRIGKPRTHENLTIFYIHGQTHKTSKPIVTLKEAMEKKIVTVHETSNVNLLSIENTSTDIEVFIMSGDVVKGGKQDRTIAFDLVIPAKSGNVPLPAFCVEQGRWSQRGGEAAGVFACSDQQVCSKEMKIAVNEARQQSEVWKEVAKTESKISSNVGRSVAGQASPTSLQLTLENKDLQSKVSEYEKALADVADAQEDVVGMAVVINGKISGADIFGSAELFRKLYPKLLKSAATEAFSELKKDAKFDVCKSEEVTAFLAEASQAPVKEVVLVQQNRGQTLNNDRTQNDGGQSRADATAGYEAPKYRCRIMQHTSQKSLLVESHDKNVNGLVWHRCYIAKDEPKTKEKPKTEEQQRERR